MKVCMKSNAKGDCLSTNVLLMKTSRNGLLPYFMNSNECPLFLAATATECDTCNRNGRCLIQGSVVTCECRDWFAGRNCQINLKLLLIVGCVSVALMIFIACGVSCFCCRDGQKNLMPCECERINSAPALRR